MRQFVDSIIVHGNPNPRIAAERAEAAYKQVWHQSGVASNGHKLMVVATGNGHNSDMIFDELERLDIPPSQLRQESNSRDTLGNIRNALPLCQGDTIGFTSNLFHLIRSKYLFTGLQMEGSVPEDYKFVAIPSKTRPLDLAYELAATPLTRARTLQGFTDASLNNGGLTNYLASKFYHNGKNGESK